MIMKRLSEIFDIWYGVNLEVVNCEESNSNDWIPFVSRTSENNGISTYVEKIDDIEPNPAFSLSIAGSWSVLATFFHDYEYYSGRDLYIAKPRIKLSKQEMLFYCTAIEANKYRYSYGRQANRTLRDIMVPAPEDIPNSVKSFQIEDVLKKDAVVQKSISLDIEGWKRFRYDEAFIIGKGYYNKKPEETENWEIVFIWATETNNGVTSRHSLTDIEDTSKDGSDNNHQVSEKIFSWNCITVSNNGSVGCAFYQQEEFTCTHDVNILRPKIWDWNKYSALFVCTLIEKEKYRWAYGRKWRPTRMPGSLIKLPITSSWTPDWQFMEEYINSLPYSCNL